MISLAGPQRVVETLHVVSSAHLTKSNQSVVTGDDSLEALRRAYHLMIGDKQPTLRAVLPAETYPITVSGGDAHAGLITAFLHSVEGEDSVDYQIFTAEERSPEDSVSGQQAQVNLALDALAESWPEFRGLYELIVPVLLFAPDQGLAGGTASTVLGVLWLDPKRHWSRTDMQEFLLHEFVHHTLFLEERRFGFYQNMELLVRDEYLTHSAIRQDRRPLDKVLHSIVVGTEILLARLEKRIPHTDGEAYNLHPESGALLEGLHASLAEVFRLPLDELLQPRPIEILDLCRKRLDQEKI